MESFYDREFPSQEAMDQHVQQLEYDAAFYRLLGDDNIDAVAAAARADTLCELSEFLFTYDGRRADAFSALDEFIGLIRHLSNTNPTEYAGRLADALSKKSAYLSLDGFTTEAVVTAEEAIAVGQHVSGFEPEVASLWLRVSTNQYELGMHDQALQSINKSVETWQSLYVQAPTKPLIHKAELLHELRVAFHAKRYLLLALGKEPEAMATEAECATTESALAELIGQMNSEPDEDV